MMYSNRLRWSIFLMSCALGSILLAYSTQSHETGAIFIKATDPKMLYLIISPHRPGECSKAIDAIAELDADRAAKAIHHYWAGGVGVAPLATIPATL